MMQYSIDSKLSEVRHVASAFRNFCEHEQIDPTMAGQVELALVEALNNIIIHAYNRKQGNPIDARFERTSEQLMVHLTDEGKAMPDSVQKAEHHVPDNHGLPEGGWGLALITALTDQISYQRQNNKNTLSIAKQF